MNRPDRQLVPGQQIAGERQQERQHEHDDADVPVELPGRLVRSGQEDPHHVQHHRDDHRMRAPPVQLAHDPQRHVLAQADDIGIGVLERGPVVEHEEDAGERQDEKQEETQPAHAPGVPQPHTRFPKAYRVEVKEHVR